MNRLWLNHSGELILCNNGMFSLAEECPCGLTSVCLRTEFPSVEVDGFYWIGNGVYPIKYAEGYHVLFTYTLRLSINSSLLPANKVKEVTVEIIESEDFSANYKALFTDIVNTEGFKVSTSDNGNETYIDIPCTRKLNSVYYIPESEYNSLLANLQITLGLTSSVGWSDFKVNIIDVTHTQSEKLSDVMKILTVGGYYTGGYRLLNRKYNGYPIWGGSSLLHILHTTETGVKLMVSLSNVQVDTPELSGYEVTGEGLESESHTFPYTQDSNNTCFIPLDGDEVHVSYANRTANYIEKVVYRTVGEVSVFTEVDPPKQGTAIYYIDEDDNQVQDGTVTSVGYLQGTMAESVTRNKCVTTSTVNEEFE